MEKSRHWFVEEVWGSGGQKTWERNGKVMENDFGVEDKVRVRVISIICYE